MSALPPLPFVAVDLAKSYLLLNHGPVTLVSSAADGVRNVMAAAWTMPLDFSPAKVAVVIDKQSQTRQLVDASGLFALNIPVRAQAAQVLAAGSVSGRDLAPAVDKFAHCGLQALPGPETGVPLVAGCAGWLECRVLPEVHNQQVYDLFIGEVVAAWADPALFVDGRWQFAEPAQRTMHYRAGGHFFVTGEEFSL